MGSEIFTQVMKEQEHNHFAQTVRRMTRMQHADFKALVMMQIIEQVTSKHSLAQQHLLHERLKKFRKDREKAIG